MFVLFVSSMGLAVWTITGVSTNHILYTAPPALSRQKISSASSDWLVIVQALVALAEYVLLGVNTPHFYVIIIKLERLALPSIGNMEQYQLELRSMLDGMVCSPGYRISITSGIPCSGWKQLTRVLEASSSTIAPVQS